MKPSGDDILLSKNNAKTLLFRNAVNTATLKEETRWLQKEWKSEEKLFLKQREQMLQRQSNLVDELSPRSRRKELDANLKRQMLSASSTSLPEQSSPPRTRVTVSRSKTFSDSDRQPVSTEAVNVSPSNSSSSLTKQSTPPHTRVRVARSKTFSGADNRPLSSSASFATGSLLPSSLSMSDQQSSLPRSRSKLSVDSISRLSNNSLAVSLPDINTTAVKTAGKKLSSDGKVLWKGSKTGDEKICALDDWDGLRNCRYLRTYSTEN